VEAPALWVPAGHTAGSSEGELQLWPAGHDVHSTSPSRLKEPAGHDAGEPSTAHLEPAGQVVQLVRARPAENVPLGQGWLWDWGPSGANVPGCAG
jgi:hypothetical protein